jgi:hypothetical protein
MRSPLNNTPVRWLIVAALGITGLTITRHYGESWDERQFFKYADRAVAAYSSWPRSGSIPITGNTYDNYGPAYVMFTALVARGLGYVLPWSISDLRHLVYFVTFAAGMWVFYRFCRRWLGTAAAIGATLLLATQPVIWGHAFISPKDIPFLAFFVLTLHLGLRMVDAFATRSELGPGPVTRRLWVVTAAWMAVVLGVTIATPAVHAQIEIFVGAAAAGQVNVLSGLASDIRTADPGVYIEKIFIWFIRLRFAFLLILTGIMAAWWSRVPNAFRGLAALAPAAIVLGLSTSIRVLGPLAALMVAGYAVRQLGRRSPPLLLAYASLALVTMYATWPYLWADPLGHLVESIQVMSQYPWRGTVLFNGVLFPSTELPAFYLPVLLGIQLTETALLAILGGVAIGIIGLARKERRSRAVLALALVWCILPLLGFMITRAPLYDNFRQVLFILPPLFMVAGLALEKVRRLPIQIAIIALAVMPGVMAGLGLHPYEYIYYNRLVGGMHGAFRRFEMDYWGTSYREAAAYLDATAPANATVWVEGPTHILQEYARPDLKIYSTYEPERADHYDYVVALTRFDLDLASYPEAPVEHAIERQGALLTVIKKP